MLRMCQWSANKELRHKEDSGIQGKSDNEDLVKEASLNRCWNS